MLMWVTLGCFPLSFFFATFLTHFVLKIKGGEEKAS
jgi:hypothetical protein